MGKHQQFNDLISLCFSQLKTAEDSTAAARLTLQRIYCFGDDFNDKGRIKAGRPVKRMLVGFLALFAFIVNAGDYPFLVNTNMADALGPNVQWRFCLEVQTYTVVKTNWVQGALINGKLHEIAVLMTNETITFDYKGKTYVQPVDVKTGPIVGQRTIDIPSPVTIDNLIRTHR